MQFFDFLKEIIKVYVFTKLGVCGIFLAKTRFECVFDCYEASKSLVPIGLKD